MENIVHPNGSELYVIEGPDGVGKSTITALLADRFRRQGKDVLCVSFPGKNNKRLGGHIYKLHHEPTSYDVDSIDEISLQMLHVAAHIDTIRSEIIPALNSGKTVILDRYWWSTYVYGIASGIKKNLLKKIIDLEEMVWCGYKPTAIYLITTKSPYIEQNSIEDWKMHRALYREIARNEAKKQRILLIKNDSPEQAVSDILNKSANNSVPLLIPQFELDLSDEKGATENKLTVDQPTIIRWHPLVPTAAFHTYWRFAVERQEIFFRRMNQKYPPFTDDGVLRAHKFTNAYRASDRVSQYLIRNVIYNDDQDMDEVFFRIMLFKTFNKIETWQLLTNTLGHISFREISAESIDHVLTGAMKRGDSIYSGAYIMPSGGSSFGQSLKHRNHLALIFKMMNDEIPKKICDTKSMEEVFDLLKSYPMIGSFLAFQYAIDINYSTMTNFDEGSFVVAGPGAKDGIKKCFSDSGGRSESDIIKLMAERQEEEFQKLGLKFKSLWGRPLQLIDCQNLFCEVDKYSRIAHPEIIGLSGRKKIKQKFKPIDNCISFFYPPKWGINEKIAAGAL
jgi:thymidylate kinase